MFRVINNYFEIKNSVPHYPLTYFRVFILQAIRKYLIFTIYSTANISGYAVFHNTYFVGHPELHGRGCV